MRKGITITMLDDLHDEMLEAFPELNSIEDDVFVQFCEQARRLAKRFKANRAK